MTKNNTRQQLSFHYIGMIAVYSGYRFDKPFTDYGVDAVLEKIEQIKSNERTRYIASGKTIDVQLKSTTSSKILELEDAIKFDLKTSDNFWQ